MKIIMSSGHGKYVRGAAGYIDEVDEARKVVEQTAAMLRLLDVDITTYHDDVSKSQNENLNRIVDFHNSKSRDLDVSVHFNAHKTTSKAMGTECLYLTQNELAVRVAQDIAAEGFVNRGSKYRADLFFLNNTEAPSILIEVCFVDSSADVSVYHKKFKGICQAIAETISDKKMEAKPPMPPLPAEAPEVPVVREEFKDITATVFGGSEDPNISFYDEHELDDTGLYVALPFKFKGERPQVVVKYGQAYGIATIEDVGPWMVDDDYWRRGGRGRPMVETYYKQKKPLPRGPNKGKVPSNDAGIDLSPGLARLIGVEGKGKVTWGFYRVGGEVESV